MRVRTLITLAGVVSLLAPAAALAEPTKRETSEDSR